MAVSNKIFGKVAFGDREDPPAFAKLQGAKPGSEDSTEQEQYFLDDLRDWVDGTTRETAQKIASFVVKNKEALVKQYPALFKPATPSNTLLYRGLDTVGERTIRQLQKAPLASWHKLKDIEGYICTMPITYTPHLKIQSWTHSTVIAGKFVGDGMLVTRQSDEFFINTRTLAILFNENEREILHIGTQYKNKVYVALDYGTFGDRILNQGRQKSPRLAQIAKTLK